MEAPVHSPATFAPASERYLTLNGLRFRYLAWGCEDAQPLVLLHGHRSNADIWHTIAASFTDRYHVLALDQRGHGRTQWSPEADYTPRRWVEDLDAFLRALRLERPVLLGHSMGGRFAYLYAADHPGAVDRLVIVEAGPHTITPTERQLAYSHTPYDDIAGLVVEKRRIVSLADESLLRWWVETNAMQRDDGKWEWRFDPDLQRGVHLTVEDEAVQFAALRRIDCPTLIVIRQVQDFPSPDSHASFYRVAAAIPDARVVEVPRSRHVIPLDNPHGLIEALRTFL